MAILEWCAWWKEEEKAWWACWDEGVLGWTGGVRMWGLGFRGLFIDTKLARSI